MCINGEIKHRTTNYTNTFIEVAEDCPAKTAIAPPAKEPKSVVRAQFEMIAGNPYRYTSDDVLYETMGYPKGLSRVQFFGKSQPCLRASVLLKRYGWGIHNDSDGKIAIYAVESEDYKRLSASGDVSHLRAMRNGGK